MRYYLLTIIGLLALGGGAGCSTTSSSQPTQPCGSFGFSGTTDKDPAGNVAAQFGLSFTFHPSTCGSSCDCGKVWFVQILRIFDPADPNTFIQPNSEQEGRMVSSSEPTLKGWAIDRLPGRKLGYVRLDDSGNIEPFIVFFENFAFGSLDSPAWMHDSLQPGDKWGHKKNLQYQGITAAVCIDGGNCQARVLGMKEWIINYDKDSNTIDKPAAFDTFTWAQDALLAAVNAWNMQGGHNALPQFTFGP